MTTTMTTTNEIKGRAVMVRLATRLFDDRCTDHEATHELLTAKKAAGDAGRFTKRILPKAATAQLKALRKRARRTHIEMTSSFGDAAERILPTKNYFAYTQKFAELKRAWDALVARFKSEFEANLQLAEKELGGPREKGGLFDRNDYPTSEELEKRFVFEVSVMPLPDASSLPDDDAIRARFEEDFKRQLGDHKRDLIAKMARPVIALIEALQDGAVNASVASSLRKAVETIAEQNVTGDEGIEHVRAEIEAKLATLKVEELKKSAQERSKARKSAEEIVASMAGYA